MTIRMERRLPWLAACLIAGLTGCGGGGGGGGGTPTTPTGAQTGVFVDAPVSGLTYTCGDDTGVTSAAGEFRYDTGDTCTFSAGDLSLGQVLAQATLTPREVAAAIAAAAPAGSGPSLDAIAQNIYQLLQSLDSDGDTSNGISLPSGLDGVTFDAGLTDAVALFNVTPEDFQAQVNAVVAAVVDELDIPLEVVSVDAALEHAAEQARVLLSGTWQINAAGADPLSFTVSFLPNGTYLFGGKSDDPACVTDFPGGDVDPDGNGAEYGRFEFNPLDGSFVVTEIISDSTGSCGLSEFGADSDARAKLQVVGERLRLDTYDTADAAVCVDEGGADATDLEGARVCRYELTRALGTVSAGRTLGATRGLEGSYVLESDLALGMPSVFTIEQTATNAYRYLLVEIYGGNNTPDSEGATDGIALGTFTVGAGNVVTVNETYNTIGGDGGLGTQPAGLMISLDDDRNIVFDDEESESFISVRLPLSPRIAQSEIVGTFFPRDIGGGSVLNTQATEAFPAFLTIFENGEFLLGTYEDDADCEDASNPAQVKPDCNGIEYGRLTLDTLTGEARFSVNRDDDDPSYVDSNGINGVLFDSDNASSDRFFLRPLAQDGEVLAVGYRPLLVNGDAAETALAEIAQIDTVAQATAFAAADPDARFFLVLRPVVSSADSLEGAWQLTSVDPSTDTLVTADGVTPFVLVFQNGDEFFLSQTSASETFDGIEFGNFELRENNTKLCITAGVVDTLPTTGLIPESAAPGVPSGCLDYFDLSLAADGFTLTTLGPEAFTLGFTRISEPSLPATP